MRSPVRSGRRATAAAATLFGVLILMSLVAERPSPPLIAAAAIGGRRALWRGGAAGESRRTLEDFGADDPSLQDSKRRVPNGPDPIHNRGAGESGRSPGRA
ncbi:hypothetical protein BRADI_1g05010v3 [Brachypodium distachyon]|uniref:Uncharacterized protein n=1 Tax=Brachypodium distachyon TaxID=15368 RepID=A0A0Q3GNK4_BRADI|nr:hypothetical protein BRADI_1g05010v3 [Brachypodium distachyon]PNT73956.1 hypothetical protein BRADI_1g05010v3 [Brachypodium distachyon]